ncbi:MAG: transcriptional regulator [Myxococcaceae bacterium]|nr:transcriptional regulator [Myxococcaceae bacterium]
MPKQWDRQQLKDFLKRAGDDLRRTGEDLRTEAHRFLEEVRDPARQARMKEQLEDVRAWAHKAVSDAASSVESAVRKVEDAFRHGPTAPAARTPPTREAPRAHAEAEEGGAPRRPGRASSSGAPRSIGRKRAAAQGAARRAPAKKGTTAKKTVGGKRAPKPKPPSGE